MRPIELPLYEETITTIPNSDTFENKVLKYVAHFNFLAIQGKLFSQAHYK